MARKIDDKKLLEMHSEGIQGKDIAQHFGVSPAAVCKRLRRLKTDGPPESYLRLTNKEKSFVNALADGKSKTIAAAQSFGVTTIESAKTIGQRLSRDPDIQTAVADLLAQEGLTRRKRISKLAEHVDHPDPNVSLKALDQSFKLDGSYAPEKKIIATLDVAELLSDLDALQQARAELGMDEGDD